jgi:hypothetical protein
MRGTLIPLVAGVCLMSLCLSASAVVEEDSDADAADFAQRTAAIEAEIGVGSEAEWAGEYGFGDGLGVNVRLALAPEGGFIFIWTGCLGVYGRSYGSVEFHDGRLALEHARPNEPGAFGGFSKVLVPVSWGDRRYLIGEEQLGNFVNAVNAGLEPCSTGCARFLVRDGDEDVEVTGRPDLPAEYAARLLDNAIHAHVTRIVERDIEPVDNEYHWRQATVEIDMGRASGIWEGMEFHPTVSSSMGVRYTIVNVGEQTSQARVTDYSDEAVTPEDGICLSTKFADGEGCDR